MTCEVMAGGKTRGWSSGPWSRSTTPSERPRSGRFRRGTATALN